MKWEQKNKELLLPLGRSLPLNNHSVAGFATFMSLLGREKHFTGILIYKIVIIKIKPWTCDNKTMRKKTSDAIIWHPPPQKKGKVIYRNTPLGT